MDLLKRAVAVLLTLAIFALPAKSLNAQPYSFDTGGYGYREMRSAPSLAPAIALGAIAVIAIIAIALQSSDHHHHHHDHD